MPTSDRRKVRTRLMLGCLLAQVWLFGCRPAEWVEAEPDGQLGPRESFARIMERLESRCQSPHDTYSGNHGGIGGERTQLRVVVDPPTYQIHEPASPSGTYTAEVTIRTSTYFSQRREVLAEEDTDDGDLKDPLTEPGALTEDRPPEGPITKYESGVRRDQFVDTYDLAYEDGRWVLKSTNVGSWVQLAFEYALKDQ